MHRFFHKVRNIINNAFHGDTPSFIHIYEFTAQVLRIVEMMESVNKSPVRFLIRTFRGKLSPITHEPQIVSKRSPHLFLPHFISLAALYTPAVHRHLRRCWSFPDSDMQTVILIQLFHGIYRLFQSEYPLCEADDVHRSPTTKTVQILRIDFSGGVTLIVERTQAHSCPVYLQAITLRHCSHIYRFFDLLKYRHFWKYAIRSALFTSIFPFFPSPVRTDFTLPCFTSWRTVCAESP